MNFIVGFLNTLNFSEEQIFWIFQYLIEDVLPIDYYTTMIGV